MIYTVRLAIPANTSKPDAVEREVEVHPGTLTKIRIHFPPRCVGLAHIQIYHHERRVWPSAGEDSFIGDTFPIEFEEDYKIVEVPYKFIIRGWNLDDTYQHEPIVQLGVLPLGQTLKETLLRFFMPPGR